MGIIKGAIKTGIAIKVFEVVRREASKPENQRKAKALFDKAASRVNKERR